MASRRQWNEHQFEQLLGNLLRGGVILAAAIVAVGGILYVIRHGAETPNYHIFRGEPAEFRQLPNIVDHAVTLQRRRSLIQLGLLILIATPVLRVAFSAYGFAKQGDRTYLVITLTVLALLLYSLLRSV
jgi:uncharacterized membrane protein